VGQLDPGPQEAQGAEATTALDKRHKLVDPHLLVSKGCRGPPVRRQLPVKTQKAIKVIPLPHSPGPPHPPPPPTFAPMWPIAPTMRPTAETLTAVVPHPCTRKSPLDMTHLCWGVGGRQGSSSAPPLELETVNENPTRPLRACTQDVAKQGKGK
jgi:hypothetical protein